MCEVLLVFDKIGMVAHLAMNDETLQGVLFGSVLLVFSFGFCVNYATDGVVSFDLFVHVPLDIGHGAWVVLYHFWRKFFEYLLLCASQDERSYPSF